MIAKDIRTRCFFGQTDSLWARALESQLRRPRKSRSHPLRHVLRECSLGGTWVLRGKHAQFSLSKGLLEVAHEMYVGNKQCGHRPENGVMKVGNKVEVDCRSSEPARNQFKHAARKRRSLWIQLEILPPHRVHMVGGRGLG